MISKKENLINVLKGEEPEWVPFAPNFRQWFGHHETFDLLPQELKGKDYIEAMIALGCDIFSRNIDGGFRENYSQENKIVTKIKNDIGTERITEYKTKYGVLEERWQSQDRLSTGLTTQHLIKDWDKDRDAAFSFLDQKKFEWNTEVFESTNAQVGSHGIVNVPILGTPLKYLHELFGMEGACFFLMDYEKDAKMFCDIYWQKMMEIIAKIANHSDTVSIIMMDNVDSPFYPPNVAKTYWTPYVKQAQDLIKQKGKFLFSHACGHLSALKSEFDASCITGLEGISHKPLGDWDPEGAKKTNESFIFNGGFSANEQEMKRDEDVIDFYKEYFSEVVDKRRFIFSSSCQTSINTSWERIKLVRKICREWGGSPNECESVALVN